MIEERHENDPQKDGGAVSGEVLHGGKDDPLGGGVADLEENEKVTEGEPKQD